MTGARIVAVAMLKDTPAGMEIRVLALRPGEKAVDVAAAAFRENLADIAFALTRVATAAEIGRYFPGVARCPAVDHVITNEGGSQCN